MTPQIQKFIDRWVPSLRNVKDWSAHEDYTQLSEILGVHSSTFSKLSVSDLMRRIRAYVEKAKPLVWSPPCLKMFEAVYKSREQVVDSGQIELVMLWSLRGINPIKSKNIKHDKIESLQKPYTLQELPCHMDHRNWCSSAIRALHRVKGSSFDAVSLSWAQIPMIMKKYDNKNRLFIFTGLLDIQDPEAIAIWENAAREIDWSAPFVIEHWLTIHALSCIRILPPSVANVIPNDTLSTYTRYLNIVSAVQDTTNIYELSQAMQTMYLNEYQPIESHHIESHHIEFVAV